MAHVGVLRAPDAAIFADTGDEPDEVYAHLDWLESHVAYPIYRVSNGLKLSQALMSGDKGARPPLYVRTRRGRGMLRRQCTRNFKLKPIRRKVRELLGCGPRGHAAPGSVEVWVGISTDEVVRARPSGLRYITNRHPLIELGLNRQGCIDWLRSHGYPTPHKSSCVFCPYRSDAQWREMKEYHLHDFIRAVEFDRQLRSPEQVVLNGVETYVSGELVPLSEAKFSGVSVERFDHECEGMCGV